MTLREKIKLTIKGYKTINSLTPGLLQTKAIQALADAILPFIGIFMSARIINALFEGRELSHVVFLAALTAVLGFATRLLSHVMGRLVSFYQGLFYNVTNEPLNEKIRSMDYERVEDAAVHALREEIDMRRRTSGMGLGRLEYNFGALITNFFRIVFSLSLAVGAFTATGEAEGIWAFVFQPWTAVIVALLIFVSIGADIFRSFSMTKKRFTIFGELVKPARAGAYAYGHVMNYKAGKDIKIYNMKGLIIGELDKVKTAVDEIAKRTTKVQIKSEALGTVLGIGVSGVIYVYVALKALFGGFGPGGIVQYAGALSQLGGGISGFMSSISTLIVNADALKLFYNFIEMPDKMQSGTLTTEKRIDNDYEIEFSNVSFKYPGSENWALRNLNMKFNIGQKMAIVGQNGSGKTTMIKLLCRLYDPTEGVITLNGVDIRKYNYKEYLDIFSVVFQDFRLFSFSLGSNVAANVNVDKERAMDCLIKAGFGERMADMHRGLDTPIYKDFENDGVEISGGEAQKIALARALYKEAPFIILDEPTAALDPISEFEIYSKFNEIVGGKTAIYISHRLSSCRFCDDIAVFHEGKLVQRGSHDKLVEDEAGKYRELWFAQAQYYDEGVA